MFDNTDVIRVVLTYDVNQEKKLEETFDDLIDIGVLLDYEFD